MKVVSYLAQYNNYGKWCSFLDEDECNTEQEAADRIEEKKPEMSKETRYRIVKETVIREVIREVK